MKMHDTCKQKTIVMQNESHPTLQTFTYLQPKTMVMGMQQKTLWWWCNKNLNNVPLLAHNNHHNKNEANTLTRKREVWKT